MSESKDIAEAEWLAGWIALTFLSNPESAYLHFQEIWNVSSRPISKARAAYWMGNALEEVGSSAESQAGMKRLLCTVLPFMVSSRRANYQKRNYLIHCL